MGNKNIQQMPAAAKLLSCINQLNIQRAGLQHELDRMRWLTAKEELNLHEEWQKGKIRGLELGIDAINQVLKEIN